MTNQEKELLSNFEARLRQLIYLHDELKLRNVELQQLLNEKEEALTKMSVNYTLLEKDYNNLKSATALSLNGGDVKQTRDRLTKLVREIDKCITLLK